jgi:hypothetical protein
MDTRKFDPAFGTEDGFADELYGNKQSKIDKVKKWSKPPHNTPPRNDDSHTESKECDEVVDHLFVKKFEIDLIDKVGRDGKDGQKLEHKCVGEVFKDTFIQIEP